jgi:hypothetical protein
MPSGAQSARIGRHVIHLLDSADPETCEVIRNLVFHEAETFFHLNPKLRARVISLLRFFFPAFLGMSKIGDICKAMKTNMWEGVRYLHSCNWRRARWYGHGCAPLVVLAVLRCVIFLPKGCFSLPPYSVDDAEVRRSAIQALSQMTSGQTISEATQKYVPDLLESDTETMKWTCDLLGNLAYYGSMPAEQLNTIISATKSCSLHFGSSF